MNEKLMKIIKEHPEKIIAIGALLLVIMVFCMFSLPVYLKAEEKGNELGRMAGTAAGYASGIVNADIKAAEAEGKQEALAKPEINMKLIGENKINETGKLDVLVAGVRLNNFHGVGNKYAALYLMKADAVFSVNLGLANVAYVEEELWVRITVPQPEVTVYFDESETEKIAEWQKNYFSGDAGDGYQAYMNTMKEIEATASEDLARNESLMESARKAAEQQIKLLATSIYGMNVSVTVEFQ
ncbi:MAG: DUF4230 domain-containing protein [Lachnospiraceae bacterium]|nr:DUF4230 domain-containing protein [Lachnospiraceae bacterium]